MPKLVAPAETIRRCPESGTPSQAQHDRNNRDAQVRQPPAVPARYLVQQPGPPEPSMYNTPSYVWFVSQAALRRQVCPLLNRNRRPSPQTLARVQVAFRNAQATPVVRRAYHRSSITHEQSMR